MPGRQRGPQARVLTAPPADAGFPARFPAPGILPLSLCPGQPARSNTDPRAHPLGDEGTKEEEENLEQGLGGKWRREGLKETRPRGSSPVLTHSITLS